MPLSLKLMTIKKTAVESDMNKGGNHFFDVLLQKREIEKGSEGESIDLISLEMS